MVVPVVPCFHKFSHVNQRQAIEGSFRMRSKGSHFTLGVWGLRVCSPDVVQPFAAGLHLFFFWPPRPPRPLRIRSLAIAARSSMEILMDTAMLIDLPDSTTMRSPDVISCHGYGDLLSWLAYVVMQHSSFERAENRNYVNAGPHVCNMLCNMLCNIVEVVTHRPTGSNQPQTNSSDSAGIALRGFSICRAADDFLCTSHGRYRIEGLAGLDCHLFAART